MEGWLQWSKKEKVELNASITDVTDKVLYLQEIGDCGWKEKRLISQVNEVMMKEELDIGANNELYLWYFVSMCLNRFLFHLTHFIQGFKKINYNPFFLYPYKNI